MIISPNLTNLPKLSVLRQPANAAIKPRAIAVAHRRCKRRQLKMGACSQIFNFAFWGIYAATDIAEAEQGRVAEGKPRQFFSLAEVNTHFHNKTAWSALNFRTDLCCYL